jgi:hypothetical protein
LPNTLSSAAKQPEPHIMAVKNLKIPDVETFEKERRAELLYILPYPHTEKERKGLVTFSQH